MKYYLSGPMTGIENHNFPLFNQVAENLRQCHHDIVNPAELGEMPEPTGKPTDWYWYLKRDIKAMIDCDAVILLPNWNESRGARLEVHVAHQLDLYINTLIGPKDVPVNEWDQFEATRYGRQDRTAGKI